MRRVPEFLSRLTLVRRSSGAMGASVRSQGLPRLQLKHVAWHVACTSEITLHGMQARLHAQSMHPSASVLPARLHVLPGPRRSRPCARLMCARAACMACCMDIANGMQNDVRMLSMRHGHVGARACRPLCARACRRGAVLMKDGVFGHQTKMGKTAHLPS